jgi:hypothetical protein
LRHFRGDEQGQHREMQRVEAPEPQPHELRDRIALPQALAVVLEDHEAGQHEEEIDVDVPLREHRDIVEQAIRVEVRERDGTGAEAPERVEDHKAVGVPHMRFRRRQFRQRRYPGNDLLFVQLWPREKQVRRATICAQTLATTERSMGRHMPHPGLATKRRV